MTLKSISIASTLFIAAFSTACSTIEPAPPQGPIPTEPGDYPFPMVPPDAQEATRPAQIIGDWQTAPSEGPVMQVTIDPQRIVARSDCMTRAWTYRFDGSRLTVASSPIVSCQRMPTPFEAERFDIIDKANHALHRSGRGVILQSPGSRLILFKR